MTRYWLVLAAVGATFALGCNDKGDDSGDTGAGDADTDTDTDTDTDADAPSSAEVVWGASSVTLTVSNDGPGAYWWGIAETAGCDDCWTGEDCVYGYTTGDGTLLLYCHDAGDGGSTTLSYGGSTSDLDDTSETVFGSDAYEGAVTYMLWSDPTYGGNDLCWSWGDDASYYSSVGCSWMSR